MRDGERGMTYIEDIMTKLAKKHKLHMPLFDDDNQKR